MKAVAASSIGDYERAVAALADYYQTVERGLGASFRQASLYPVKNTRPTSQQAPCIILFGTDQGLVGQFNDRIAEFAKTSLTSTASIANSRDEYREKAAKKSHFASVPYEPNFNRKVSSKQSTLK